MKAVFLIAAVPVVQRPVQALGLMLAVCLVAASGAQAQDATKRGTFACETPGGGKVYGDRLSPECRKVPTKVLGSSGAVRGVIEAERTPEQQQLERERELARQKEARLKAQLVAKDRLLLQNYPSSSDFARFREDELRPFDEQIGTLAKRYESLVSERDGLMRQRAFYRPDAPASGTLKPEQMRMNPAPNDLVQKLSSNQVNTVALVDLFTKTQRERQNRQNELERQGRRLERLWRGEAPGFPEEAVTPPMTSAPRASSAPR